MTERHLLTMLVIEANEVSCCNCRFLRDVARARCTLFAAILEEGTHGTHRAEECLAAERRQMNVREAMKAVTGG